MAQTRMIPWTTNATKVLSLIWALIWAGVGLSFAHPPVPSAAERPTSALQTRGVTGTLEIYEHQSRRPGGPDWPLSATSLLSDRTAAWPGLSARRSLSPTTGKGLNPCELARRVSVNTLNAQGDSSVAPGGQAWSEGGCWVISQRD